MIVEWFHAESCILMYPFPAQLKQQWNPLCVPADTTVPLAWLEDGSFHVPLAPSRARSESRLLRAAFPVLLVRKAVEYIQFSEIRFFCCNFWVCHAGSFCSRPGLSEPTGLCEAGYYCLAGAASPNSTDQVLFFFVYNVDKPQQEIFVQGRCWEYQNI